METERKTMTIEEAIDQATKHVINGIEMVTIHDVNIMYLTDGFQYKIDLTRRFSRTTILKFSNCIISGDNFNAPDRITLLFGDIHVVFEYCKFPRGFVITTRLGKLEFVKCESKYDIRLTCTGNN